MQYVVELPTEDHGAEWIENAGETGMLEVVCESGSKLKAVLIEAGWAHIDYCPVCGDGIELKTVGAV